MTPAKNITVNEKGYSIKRTKIIYSSKLFIFDEPPKYSLSCNAFLKNAEKGRLYLGFINYDANNRPIASSEVNGRPQTFTEEA